MRAIEPRRVFGALVRALEADPEARAWVLGHKAEVMGWISGRLSRPVILNPAPAILGVDLGPNGGAVLLHPSGHVLDAWSWSWDEASKGGRLLTAESRNAGHHVQDLRAVGVDIGQRARRAYPGPIRIRAEVPWGNGAADLPKGQGGALDTLDGLTRALPGATVQRIGPLDWARPLGIARSAQDMARERAVYVRLQEWIARSGLRLPALYRRIRHVQDALAIAWTGR